MSHSFFIDRSAVRLRPVRATAPDFRFVAAVSRLIDRQNSVIASWRHKRHDTAVQIVRKSWLVIATGWSCFDNAAQHDNCREISGKHQGFGCVVKYPASAPRLKGVAANDWHRLRCDPAIISVR